MTGIKWRGHGLAFVLLATAAGAGAEAPKVASPATVTGQQAIAVALPADDGRDGDFAARGFVATLPDPLIKAADGRTGWNLAAYDFVSGPAPATVNPSLCSTSRSRRGGNASCASKTPPSC